MNVITKQVLLAAEMDSAMHILPSTFIDPSIVVKPLDLMSQN